MPRESAQFEPVAWWWARKQISHPKDRAVPVRLAIAALDQRFAKTVPGGLFGPTCQGMRLMPLAPAMSFQLAACTPDSNRAADVRCHDPPRSVRMPRSFS